MKIAVTGKGGVGKTTLAAVLARLYASEGKKVLAADVDPDANLGLALGFSAQEVENITPISKMSDFIAERTATNVDSSYGKFFKINPKVDDIPDRFAVEKNGVKLLVMGYVDVGGSGCVCPEHVILKRVISNLVIARDEVVILDMEAGLEHLGRGTADFVDRFIVVIEPGERSVQTYRNVKRLAADIGVKQVNVVANKIRDEADREFVRRRIPEEDLLGFITFSEEVQDADRAGKSPFDISKHAVEEIKVIKDAIERKSAVK